MGVMMIGSVNAYTRTMKMSAMWKQKQENKNYTEKSEDIFRKYGVSLQQIEQARESGDPEKAAVYQKLSTGKKLTAEEEEYLREHDAASYQQYKEVQAEKESYEKALKRCKTKEEVERLQTTRLGVRLASANAIANNPNIPKSKKMELLMYENAKTKAIAEMTLKFKDSLAYEKLPEESENAKEDKPVADEKLVPEDSSIPEETLDPEEKPVPEEGAVLGEKQEPVFYQRPDKEETAHAYGRRVYQQEAFFKPDSEKILKDKKG